MDPVTSINNIQNIESGVIVTRVNNGHTARTMRDLARNNIDVETDSTGATSKMEYQDQDNNCLGSAEGGE